ncbi:uncharacterized protein LOC125867197 [Solanum stenotomum]|uniref:uncharacterized protein LOC125867197 n=1 Tax=Solanum stenotomum TaxID=172797 RepID=UPI0020D08819|nr:uncharacterized protein LOC125867197 [Solanum stenotomum]
MASNRTIVGHTEFKGRKSNLVCSHCKKPSHSIDKCYRITGFSVDFKFTKSIRLQGGVKSNAIFGHQEGDDYPPTTMDNASGINQLSQDQFPQLVQLLHQVKVSRTEATTSDVSANSAALSSVNQQVINSAIAIHEPINFAQAPGIFLSVDSFLKLVAYYDADWGSCLDSRRSVSGFFITLGGSTISWKSEKQLSISLSSAKAGYRSMRGVVAELTWLNRLLLDIGFPPELPIPVHSDSQSAIHIARKPVFHERIKYVELDCHFVGQQFLVGLISLSYVLASSQIDLFTKDLSGSSHQVILPKLGLLPLPSNLRRGVENENHSTPLLLLDRIKDEEKKEKKKSVTQMLASNADG